MIADYSAEIKIEIFQSISERQRDEWRFIVKLRANRGKIARFNSVMLTKFVQDVARILSFNIL